MNEETAQNPATTHRFLFGVSDFSTSEPLINAEKIVASGMDFIEPGLAKIAAMSEPDFNNAVERIHSANIRVLSANWFLPGELLVTGPDADIEECRPFVELAFKRATTLGAEAIVFGSPGSRNVPPGYDPQNARVQMIDFCQMCSEVICQNDWQLKVAVEHVNHTETNFINTFGQALSLVREVDRKEIGLAADFYHFAIENEPLDILLDAGDLVCAVQIADPQGRTFPKPNTSIPGLKSFMQLLARINYSGGVSVEATVGDDLEFDCREALKCLKADY